MLIAVPVAGCTTQIPGTGTPADPVAVAETSTSASPAPSGPAPARSGLAADVVDDECLLDSLQFSDLLGEPVLPPEQTEVPRADGSSSTSCYADSARGFADPLASINVYEPRSGSPADFVRAAPPQGRRDLTGAGQAAVLIDTTPGVTLQVASPRYVVTIAVLDGAPSDDAWRAAAAAALAALPT